MLFQSTKGCNTKLTFVLQFDSLPFPTFLFLEFHYESEQIEL